MNTATKPQPRLAEHETAFPSSGRSTAAAKMVQAGEELVARNLNFALGSRRSTSACIRTSPPRTWCGWTSIPLRLRDFSAAGASGIPTIVDAPFAGHSSTIADYHRGQSLVETPARQWPATRLRHRLEERHAGDEGLRHDHYLAELPACIDDLGGRRTQWACARRLDEHHDRRAFPDKNRPSSPVRPSTPTPATARSANSLTRCRRPLRGAGGNGWRAHGRPLMLQAGRTCTPDVQYMQKYLSSTST